MRVAEVLAFQNRNIAHRGKTGLGSMSD